MLLDAFYWEKALETHAKDEKRKQRQPFKDFTYKITLQLTKIDKI